MSEEKRTTPDQQRASHAWEVVTRVKGARDQKEFGTQARKLPTRILASGLGAALAFLEAKKYAPQLVEALADWMSKVVPPTTTDKKRLVLRVIDGDTDFLRFATVESLAYLQWLVRFAEAEGLTKE